MPGIVAVPDEANARYFHVVGFLFNFEDIFLFFRR